jgi:hypothetical protein
MRSRPIIVAWLALVMAWPARAQTRTPPSADPEAAIVEELVVVSRHPEPAWWRVERAGGGVVYVLGAPDAPLPPDVTWRRETLNARLEGAERLITAPRLHAGLEDLFGLISLYGQLRSKTPMEESLTPKLQARFVAERERLGKGPEPYAHWRPFVAGLILLRDVRPQGSRDIGRQVHGEASRRGVPVKAAGEYDLVPFARTALGSLTPASEGECLAAALDDAERGADAFRRAAAGWARGDVATALTAPRHFDRCLLLMAGGPQLWRQSTDDLAAAITEEAAKPGAHAVAIVPLRRLLAKDGLIDTLKAHGLKVAGPDDPAD